jgi:hypothetical protein
MKGRASFTSLPSGSLKNQLNLDTRTFTIKYVTGTAKTIEKNANIIGS